MSMILVPDNEVPPSPAHLTLGEFCEGMVCGLYDPKRGDVIVEWYRSMAVKQPGLLGRVWYWRNGEPVLGTALWFHPSWRVIVLWFALPKEKLN